MKNLFFLTAIMFLFSTEAFSNEIHQGTKPFFKATYGKPYHISVGGVLFNEKGQIACHHFENIFGYTDIYYLMRKSMENDETPLMTLKRGLIKEFGATAEPVAFLGTLCGYLPDVKLSFEKTTLYVACQVIDWNPEKRDLKNWEGQSVIEWFEPEELIDIMRKQGIRCNHRIDIDESEIIIRALPFIQQRVGKK